MKLLLISGARIVGGAERVTLQLGAELMARGYQVEALCPSAGQWRTALTRAGIVAHPAPIGGALNFLTSFVIAQAAGTFRPDLLMVTTSDEWVWACLTPRRACAPRLVLVRHMGLPLALRVRRLAGWRADAIVAVSHSVRQSLLAGSAIAPGKVRVIPNAVRFAINSRVPDPLQRRLARTSLGLPEGGRWIGFLGGINLGKGIEDVMVAAGRANRMLGDVHLLVCGSKDLRQRTPDCGELARRCGIEEIVHYMGQLDDVIPAITACDVLAIATHRALREGLAQSALDAMACGTPIAAYALEGVIDAVGETDAAAVLARPDDVADLGAAIIGLLSNPELAASIARRGLDRARAEFEPAQMADRYEQLFGALTADRAGD